MESSQNQTIIQQRPGEPAIQLQYVLCVVFCRFSYMFFAFEMFREVPFVLAIYSQKEKIKKYKSVKLKCFLRFSIARVSQIFEKKIHIFLYMVQVGSQNKIYYCGEFSPFWKKRRRDPTTSTKGYLFLKKMS
jgi:hypothetical protein